MGEGCGCKVSVFPEDSSYGAITYCATHAAAPKLLEALEDIAESCDAYGARYYGGGTAAQLVFEIGEQAHTAIGAIKEARA